MGLRRFRGLLVADESEAECRNLAAECEEDIKQVRACACMVLHMLTDPTKEACRHWQPAAAFLPVLAAVCGVMVQPPL